MPRTVVEFSLALNNRTGKYFIGRDLLQDAADLVEPVVRYWRVGCRRTPDGLWARILGRLMTLEVNARARVSAFDRLVPRMRPPQPVLFTDPLQCLLYRLRAEDVVLCHDMGPITHPGFYARGVEALYQKIFSEILSARPNLVFVTQSSRQEFERLYGPAYASVQVIAPAVRDESVEGDAAPPKDVRVPFLLTVGAFGDRKNQAGVIQAFRHTGLHQRGYQYVICGGPEPGAERVEALAVSTPGVVMTGYVKDAELRWLYANTSGFVLPSLLEGFGIPAAEAIARSLVPLVSREGALSEVTGPEAVLVDPSSPEDIARGLDVLVSMEADEKMRRLRDLRARVAKFSPDAAREAWRSAIDAVNRSGRLVS